MFRKKKLKIQEEKVDPSVRIQKIPDVFFGGQDPEIYHAKEQSSSQGKPHINKPMTSHPSSAGKKFLGLAMRVWVVIASVFVLIMALVVWYYLSQLRSSVQQTPTPQKVEQIQQTPELIETEPEINPTTTTEEIIEDTTSTVSQQDPFAIQFPPLLTLNTADLDADELTDIEEGLFNTDSGTWDTDEDVYYDGQEIFNLYNPKGFAPVKLIDSGLVREYINTQGYRIYYPFSWQFGEVDVEQTQVLFSAISGEYVEVRVFDKEPGQDFISWFASHAKGQSYTDLAEFTNRFKEKGMRRSDHLVAYFETETTVFVIVYHQNDAGPVPYRGVVKMMYQSFRPQKTDVEIPDQQVFGGVTSTVIVPEPSTSTEN